MRVKFVGFGGYMDTPCYEDEQGKLYFDENNGRNGLNLYTGAWRDNGSGEICGEPNKRFSGKVQCDEPFVRSPRERDYMLLSRLQIDCIFFINRKGNCRNGSLWADIRTILSEMERIMASFSKEEKPQWLTDADFAHLKKQVEEILQEKGKNV